MRRFELEQFLANVEKYEIRELALVPPMFVGIIMSGLAKNYSMKSVKHVTCGAAPLGREEQVRFRKFLEPGVAVVQVWGMTEASCVASQFYHPEDDETGSVGRILPGLDAK